jgi:tetratricopeptide (TPR) repeat protein
MFHIDTTVSVILVAVVAVVTLIMVAKQGKGSSRLDEIKADDFLQRGHLERQKGNYVEQEYLLQKALEILGPRGDFTKRSSCLVHLVDSYTKQGKLQEARTMSKEMLDYWRSQIANPTDVLLKDFDYFIATADFASATYDVAEFYRTVPDLKRRMFGMHHSEVADSLMLLSRLQAKLGDKAAAANFEAEANAIRTGTYHPGTTTSGAEVRFPDSQGNEGEVFDAEFEPEAEQ